MNDKKNNMGLVLVIILLLLVIIGLLVFIITKEYNNVNSVNVDNKTSTTIKKKVVLSEKELEEYLSYVPFYNSEDLSGEDAYTGSKKTIGDFKEEVLLQSVFSKAEKIDTKEIINHTLCGTCEGEVYVSVDEFNKNAKKMYNLDNITKTSFSYDDGAALVEKSGNYYVALYGGGNFYYSKILMDLEYEISDNNLILYEKSAFVLDSDDGFGLYKYNGSNLVKEYDYDILNDMNSIESLSKQYILDNYVELSTFKHIFNKNELGYYYYSTESI